MIRRSILQFKNVPLRTTTQVPSYLSSRAYSATPKNEPHNKGSNPTEPKSNLPKFIIGGVVVGSALSGAYYYGYLGEYNKTQNQEKNNREVPGANPFPQVSDSIVTNIVEKPNVPSPSLEHAEEILPEHTIKTEAVSSSQVTNDTTSVQGSVDHVEESKLASVPENSIPSDNATIKPTEESVDLNSLEVKHDQEHDKASEVTPVSTEIEINSVPTEQISTTDVQEIVQSDATQPSSLLGDYYIKEDSEDLSADSLSKQKDDIPEKEDSVDGYISKDGVLVLNFLQAIHAAEERQAALDARSFAEEMRAIKEKYEKEIRDARVRELMYAEREAILDKELKKERVKAAAALESLQEELEEKLISEVEQKELEAEEKLKKLQDIAKAELAAAIANEKASQIEKMAEANLNIDALCMAFYARSEEARQSHSIHKLAIGALALEDALAKGLPIQKDIEALNTQLEGVDQDSLITLVLSSLPEDTKTCGTDTLSQLSHKFDALKGTLRHFSLIPPGGGGILTHSVAHIASFLKVKEADQSGDGSESLINKVERLLAEGKLSEAADALENGAKGSQAAEVVDDWVRRARNRAITEQALTVLQSYATSISLP